MKEALSAMVVTVLLSGCAAPIYDKYGQTQAGFDSDVARCRYEATAATSGYGTGATRRGVSGAAGQGVGEGIAQALDQGDLMNQCLLARGYTRR